VKQLADRPTPVRRDPGPVSFDRPRHTHTGVTMKRRAKSIIAGGCLAGLLGLTGSHGVAAGETGFTLASLQGVYAGVTTIGHNVGSAAVVSTFDGAGNFSGSGMLNIPSPSGQRLIIPITFVGTYTVNANGSGTAALMVTLPDGRELHLNDDTVITQATRHGNQLLATQLFSQRREPSQTVAGNLLVTVVSTRLHD
jgi:hypothetical protein